MCVVVTGWEDEDVLMVGFTEEPSRKRRKVTDEGDVKGDVNLLIHWS